MLQVARWRIILVALVTALGIVFALPNFLPQSVRDSLPGFMPRQALNLGLDLRGGSQLLLEVDVATLRQQQLENVTDQMAEALREASPAIRYTGRGVVGDAARVRLIEPADTPRALQALRPLIQRPASGGDANLAFTQGADGLIEARISDASLQQLSRQAVDQSREVIRKRIDPNGTSEVSIVRQGNDRIVIQAPGVADPQQLKRLIGQTALMTFHLVDDSATQEDMAAGRMPPGTMVVQPFPGIGDGAELVRRRPSLTGEHLTNATPRYDSTIGQWVLGFDYDSEGARIFCRLTTDNVGRRFAILLDNQVLTAPVIRGAICGSGGQIEGNFTPESATELADMLKAGALPVPLTVIEERTVGPELGQDAINAGAQAGVIAGICVLVFMAAAYGLFGLVACLALVVNAILILASMSVIGASLTLPGIAGLILTIAMAVDANVLIYERMREEQRAGRGPAIAIDSGFARAMITIIDANLTTILAALILFQFGAGPVRGFAWTLSIGVITSVFSAVLVTQILIAWWFRAARPKQLPI
jgi:preprotein translocase subunit SecD